MLVDEHLHGANRPACPAAQELPDGHLEVLGLEIPQRLVHRADGPGDGHAPEAEGAVGAVPVVLHVEGLRTHEGSADRPDDLGHSGRPAEEGRLSDARGAVLGRDADVAEAAGRNGFDRSYAHDLHRSL